MTEKRKPNFAPTSEQSEILKAFRTTKRDLAIQAFAGSGKTSTLRLIALAHPEKKFLYVAYNKALEIEAASSFPPNVSTRTAHSLAYRSLAIGRSAFQPRLGAAMRPQEVLALARIQTPRGIPPLVFASALRQIVRSFQCSASSKVTEEHIPDEVAALIKRERTPERLVAVLLKGARALWSARADIKSAVPIEHDTYLKLWQLGKPKLEGFDCILFDEAQDANPVILDVVRRQKCRKVYVGDSFQQIYSWRGAVNAFDSLGTVTRLLLSRSFRFGEAVAKAGRDALTLHGRPTIEVHFEGFEKVPSFVGAVPSGVAYGHIFRTNAALLDEAFRLAQKKTPFAIVGDFENLLTFLASAYALYKGRLADVQDERLRVYRDFGELLSAAKYDAELKGVVKLVDAYGDNVPSYVRAVRSCRVEEAQARVILTSTHRAKGREWDYVRIESDFGGMPSGFKEDPSRPFEAEEINLLYVALTRARHGLEISSGLGDLLAGTSGVQKKSSPSVKTIVNSAASTSPTSQVRQGASCDSKRRENNEKPAFRRKSQIEEPLS
jgi:hypothetical protein